MCCTSYLTEFGVTLDEMWCTDKTLWSEEAIQISMMVDYVRQIETLKRKK